MTQDSYHSFSPMFYLIWVCLCFILNMKDACLWSMNIKFYKNLPTFFLLGFIMSLIWKSVFTATATLENLDKTPTPAEQYISV